MEVNNGAPGLRILRKSAAARKLGVHPSTPVRWATDPRYAHMGFPKPIALGDCSVGFVESEIDAWIASRPRISGAGRAV